VITPSRGWLDLNLKELWEYRELLYFFVWRDIKVRYKQTIIGAGWAIIQPFFTMVVASSLGYWPRSLRRDCLTPFSITLPFSPGCTLPMP
jgi:hypothetical protein